MIYVGKIALKFRPKRIKQKRGKGHELPADALEGKVTHSDATEVTASKPSKGG